MTVVRAVGVLEAMFLSSFWAFAEAVAVGGQPFRLLGPFPCEPFHIRVFPWLRPAFVFCVGCLLPTGLLPNVDPHR